MLGDKSTALTAVHLSASTEGAAFPFISAAQSTAVPDRNILDAMQMAAQLPRAARFYARLVQTAFVFFTALLFKCAGSPFN